VAPELLCSGGEFVAGVQFGNGMVLSLPQVLRRFTNNVNRNPHSPIKGSIHEVNSCEIEKSEFPIPFLVRKGIKVDSGRTVERFDATLKR
jgi:hypothetical protein